jgi:hypothetical protein
MHAFDSLSNLCSIYVEHFHPFLDPVNGNILELPPAPEPEDLYASLNSYLEVILRATDEDGLTGETSVLLQPSLVEVNVATYPIGLDLLVDEESVLALDEVWSWNEHDLKLRAENQPPYIFTSWSDGITLAERTVRLNMTDPFFVANFCVEDGGPCDTDKESCCNNVCNDIGKCGEVELDTDTSLTKEPDSTHETTPPADNPSNNDNHASRPPTSVEQENEASNVGASAEPEKSSEPEKGMSAVGKAVLIAVVLVVLAVVAYLGLHLLHKRNQLRDQRSIQRSNSIGGTSNFDIEKLAKDVGESSSDDGNTLLQTSSC